MCSEDGLITVAQLADAFEIPPEQVLRWRMHGQGPPPVDAEPIPRWRAEDVQAWLADRLRKEQFRPPPAAGSLI